MTEPADLVLRNARLVTAAGATDADLAIRHGRIAGIQSPGERPWSGRESRDLHGLLVLPGLIDGHVHFREPGGHSHKGTYPTESAAAAAGGVTTVLTMPNTVPFTGTREVLAAVRACAAGRCSVDYGFHFGARYDNLDELPLVRNVPSFKLYLNETTGITSPLFDEEVLKRVFATGHLVMAHAEEATLDRLLELHCRHGAGPLHVAHVARAREVTAIRAARARRQPVTAEVTPHHLLLSVDDLGRLGPLGDMRPMLQTRDDVAALWAGLADGTIDAVASDHAPHLLSEKSQSPPPPGVPGLQTMLPLLLTAASEGRIALTDLVRWTSRNPAAIFGLHQKGEVRLGADADLAVVEPDAEWVIRNDEQLTLPGWTPFAGRTCRGRVVTTILRGQVIYDSGRLCTGATGREVRTRDPGAWQDD